MQLNTSMWLAAAGLVIAGAIIGYLICYVAQQRSGGGKNAKQLKEEFDEYKEGVSSHFEKSALLFKDMTERYRDIYQHMAEGANTLGREGSASQLPFQETALLTTAPVTEQVASDESLSTGPGATEAGDAEQPNTGNGEFAADEAMEGAHDAEPTGAQSDASTDADADPEASAAGAADSERQQNA